MTSLSCPTDLSDGVIRLRRWRADEAEVLVALLHASLDTVSRWIPWCTAEYGVLAAQRWLGQVERSWERGRGECALAIVDARTDAPVGSVAFNRFREPATADLGYWMSTAAQGQGWMTRAVRPWVPSAMMTLGLETVEVVIAEGNLASRRVAEKAGARYDRREEGRLGHPDLTWAAIYEFNVSGAESSHCNIA